MSDMKSKLKHYYQNKSLTEKQLSKINRLYGRKKAKFPVFKYLAAICTLSIAVFVFIQGDLKKEIMSEVVKNHLKEMPVEVKTDDMMIISKTLAKLDFSLIHSSYTSELELVGGRYCYIKGKMAAQLAYKDSKGKNYTIYQLPIQDKFRTVSGKISEAKIKGVDVHLYSEGGLMIGIASSNLE